MFSVAVRGAVPVLAVALNAIFDAILYVPMGTGGIPLATSISSIITFLVLIWLLEREMGGLHRDQLIDGAARSLVASGVSVLLGWETWTVLDDWLGRSTIAQIVSVGGAIAAATAAYLAAARAFEMPELAALSRLRRPLR